MPRGRADRGSFRCENFAVYIDGAKQFTMDIFCHSVEQQVSDDAGLTAARVAL